ncbi:EAL domain-containing protein [Actinoplanes sp. NBC_00393]|uniref:putative bifunctional diguanylate cyclase/phosphodiesterase n=1 Tax=Actinoplanes sp. NBC_00393 TaxID=2975953 RepID=UPI002E1BFE2F
MTKQSSRSALVVSTGLGLFAVLVFALNLTALRGPLFLLWLAGPLSTIVPVVVALRISCTPSFPLPTRRFWRHLATVAALAGLGSALNAWDVLGTGAAAQNMSAPTVAVFSAAVLTLLWGLFRLPLGVSGRGELLRIGLDAGTVLLAAAVFMWQFQTRPMLEATGYQAASVIAASFTLVLELVTVFAIVKVALAGQAYLAPRALHLFAAGMFGGVLSGFLQQFIVDQPHLSLTQISIPLVMICATAAAEAQRRSGVRAPSRQSAGRSFSVFPYLAVAAVDALLLAVAWPHEDQRIVVVAAVALTGLVVWRQITAFRENTELVARLDHSSTHDPLTGLPNRALFNDRLAAALPGRVSVALIDLDDFKTVNDTLGHGAGDVLLTTVAERLSGCVRAGDTVARLGGDEFVVLLAGLDAAEAELSAQRMIAALAEPVIADGHDLLVRASIGLATSGAGDDAGELLRRADIAMYAAKHGGGSDVQSYTSGMAGAVADTAALGAQLRQAITGGQLRLAYQPIVALDGSRLDGVEALVRWQHPDRGVIPPAEFIPVAERTGLIVPLGDWVLRTACAQLAAWTAELGPLAPAMMNVNVSARQLSDAGFVDRVVQILAATGVPAHRLTLEITESTAVALGEAAGRLAELRGIGVRISLDDFGTGQSTLTLLHELAVDQLKLDRSFVQDDAGRPGLNMPAAVFALAGAAGLEIVAEGVETPEQAERLERLGYRWAQGFHFARPMPADDITGLVTRLSAPAA